MKHSPQRSLLALATLMVLAAFAMVFTSVSRSRGAMWNAVRSLREATQHQPHLREAPYGETFERAAWPHYRAAMAAVDAIPDYNAQARAFGEGKLSKGDRDQLLASAASVFEHLRAGAASRDATQELAWEDGLAGRIFRLTWVRAGSYLAAGRMEQLLEAGEPERAVEVMLDAQQFSADLASAPTVITEATGLSQLVPEPLRAVLTGPHYAMLTDEARAQWVTGLRRIEAGIAPASRSFRGDTLLAFTTIQRSMDDGSFDGADFYGDAWPAWRPGFSWRNSLALYVIDAEVAAEKLDAAYRLPRAQIAPEVTRVMDAFAAGFNPFTRVLLPKMGSLAKSRSESLSRLEFLRHALALDAGLADPVPQSPNANPVTVDRGGRQIVVSARLDQARRLEITVGAATE